MLVSSRQIQECNQLQITPASEEPHGSFTFSFMPLALLSVFIVFPMLRWLVTPALTLRFSSEVVHYKETPQIFIDAPVKTFSGSFAKPMIQFDLSKTSAQVWEISCWYRSFLCVLHFVIDSKEFSEAEHRVLISFLEMCCTYLNVAWFYQNPIMFLLSPWIYRNAALGTSSSWVLFFSMSRWDFCFVPVTPVRISPRLVQGWNIHNIHQHV